MMRRWSDYVRDCGQPLTSRRKRDVRCVPTPCLRAVVACHIRTYPMNISKAEQHMLHVLAQGGMLRHRRGEPAHIVEALCITRDGHVLANTGRPPVNTLRRPGLHAPPRRPPPP